MPSKPSPLQMPRLMTVLPAPRFPYKATLSPTLSSLANRNAQLYVSFSDLKIIIEVWGLRSLA